ncbi:hypothetical protein GF357_01260 [Candidatus Dojkabacteria bacterium]|nr:hypothetical protein [Candidatus Dojkabacteria bacterium]
MSKLLLSILKRALLPAALVIVGKAAGLYFAIKIFDLNLLVDNDIHGIFTTQFYFTSTADTLLANSISNSFMFLILLIGTLIFLIRANLRISANSNSETLVKIVKLNLLDWITEKDNFLLNLGIWIFFLMGTGVTTLRDSLINVNYDWAAFATLGITIVTLGFTVNTFERKINQVYPRDLNET